MELPFQLDEVQQFMADKTGYFIDVLNEQKYMQIGCDWLCGDGATDAEIKMWTAWEAAERGAVIAMNRIGSKLDSIISNLERVKATEDTNCVEPA